MYQYILRRLLYALPTLLGITLLIFFVLRILPGDPLVILYGDGGVGSLSDADRAANRHHMRLDRLPRCITSTWEYPLANLRIAAGPGVVLGLGTSACIARLARSTFLEVIREDYVRTARAKGVPETLVVLHHALRNAILPVLTISGVLFGFLLSASVAVEQAFAVSGLGTALVQAFQERDLLVVQTLVLLYGVVFVVVNLLIDLAYVWVDPRIRYT